MEFVHGIGIDIVNIMRIEDTIQRWNDKFLCRTFTPQEIRYCSSKHSPHPHYAARFAAKEAVFKAIGTGWARGVTWHDVEVYNDPHSGRPSIALAGKCLEIMTQFPAYRVLISLSHDTDYAIAQAMILITKTM